MKFIKNYFAKKRKQRQNKKAIKELETLTMAFQVFERFIEDGLIWFDRKKRRLFISEPIATLMMTDIKRWENFLNGIFHWIYYKESAESWSKFMLNEELKAVKAAREESKTTITPQDIKRIREARRKEISITENAPVNIDTIEFFIVKNDSHARENDNENTINGGHILSVGIWDGRTKEMEMEAWKNIAHFVKE